MDRARMFIFLVALSLFGLALAGSVSAFNYVVDVNGTYWGIQDADPPRVDTGSIRATQIAPGGQNGAFSTAINGFAGIKVLVQTSPAPRFNGELMRGFGLRFDGADRFKTTQSIGLGGVTISRSIYVNRGANWGRWLDTFTNSTKKPLTIKVAFGGQSGIGASGSNSSTLVKTSSGDAVVSAARTSTGSPSTIRVSSDSTPSSTSRETQWPRPAQQISPAHAAGRVRSSASRSRSRTTTTPGTCRRPTAA